MAKEPQYPPGYPDNVKPPAPPPAPPPKRDPPEQVPPVLWWVIAKLSELWRRKFFGTVEISMQGHGRPVMRVSETLRDPGGVPNESTPE